MATTTHERTYTPEDLLTMPDGGVSYELVEGRLVELKMGSLSSWIAGTIYLRIANYCEAHDLGWVWPPDHGFQCFPNEPGRVRKPDVSFVRKGRLAEDRPPVGWLKIVPDLVVEVNSPNDLASEIDRKVEDYRTAGVPLVWVVSPEARTVQVYRPDGSSARLRADDELSGEDVLPGFRFAVSDLFPTESSGGPVEKSAEVP